MGKVLSTYDIGWPGAVSRSVDDIIVSLKNAGAEPIPFGAPVFLTDGGDGVVGFVRNGAQVFDRFAGFAVRSAGKTPDAYPLSQDMGTAAGSQAGAWNPGEVAEVLVRGCVAVRAGAGFSAGDKVYIRTSDGTLVPNAGAEGTTLLLENVRIRRPQAGSGPCSEVVVTKRNIQ